MKIAVYGDNTLALPVAALCEILNDVCATVSFHPGREKVRLDVAEITTPRAYQELSKDVRTEAKEYDMAVIATAIPYDNNFFFEGYDHLVIVSFSNWHMLTDLPLTNGFVYFIASMLCEDLGPHKGCLLYTSPSPRD